MKTKHLLATATAAVLAVVLLSACGSAESNYDEPAVAEGRATSPAANTPHRDNGVAALSGTAILDRAKHALVAAESFHYAGKLAVDDGELTFDLTVAGAKGAKGRLDIGVGDTQVITTPKARFYLGDEKYFSDNFGPAAAKAFNGKWVEMNASMPDLLLPDFTTADGVAEMLLELEGVVEKAGTAMIDDTPVVGVTTADATVWVATTGLPYPVRLEGKGAASRVDFSGFGDTVEITPPAPDQVVPFAKVLELKD